MKDFAVSEHSLDSNFSLGKLNAFRIDIMNSNGYVRANSIRENDMNLVGKSKELNKWYKTKATQELIQAYAEDLKVSTEDLTVDVKSTHNNLRGVYLHPDLVIDYASWISPKFKILTQRILKDHFRSESKREISALNAQMQVKDEKIDRLEQRVIDLQKSVSDSNATINRINDTLEPLRSYREKSLTFIENSVERISCPVPENLQHRFIISAVRSNTKKDYDYVITRIQKRNKNGTLQSKAQDLGVELTTVYEVQSPNPINLSHAVSKIDGVQFLNCMQLRRGQFIKTSIVQQHFLLAVDAIVKRDLNDYKIIKSNI